MAQQLLNRVNWDDSLTDEQNIAAGALWTSTETGKIDANFTELYGLVGSGVTDEEVNDLIQSALTTGNYITQAALATTLTPYALKAEYLPLTGGTVTGTITAATAPTANNHLANKGYVDSQIVLETQNFQTAEDVQAIVDDDIATLQGQVVLKTEFAPVETLVNDATVGNNALNTSKLGSAEAATTYLALAGGTLTGAITGTTATFSGLVSASTVPTADAHLTNKAYVDGQITPLKEDLQVDDASIGELQEKVITGGELSYNSTTSKITSLTLTMANSESITITCTDEAG